MARRKIIAPPGLTRDPHVAVVDAAKRGVGLRLSAAECAYLATDDAIMTRSIVVTQGPEAGASLLIEKVTKP